MPNRGTAVTTLAIITFWKLHENICHLKFMKNDYVHLLGHHTD